MLIRPPVIVEDLLVTTLDYELRAFFPDWFVNDRLHHCESLFGIVRVCEHGVARNKWNTVSVEPYVPLSGGTIPPFEYHYGFVQVVVEN